MEREEIGGVEALQMVASRTFDSYVLPSLVNWFFNFKFLKLLKKSQILKKLRWFLCWKAKFML